MDCKGDHDLPLKLDASTAALLPVVTPMQKVWLAQDTWPKPPDALKGTDVGPDHALPLLTKLRESSYSTATQKGPVTHETSPNAASESESTVCDDHELPLKRAPPPLS